MGEVPIPAHLAVFVEALGPDGALEFLLAFGGGDLSLGSRPQANNPVRKRLGDDAARKLAAVAHRLPRTIPVGRRWMVQMLDAKGLPQAEIARRLHISQSTVKRHLRGDYDPNQLSLFD